MGTGAMTTEEYWGYLIKEDKSPAPVFEQLLLGIANYIVGHSAHLISAVCIVSLQGCLATEWTDRTLGHQLPDTSQACSLLPSRWR